MPLFQIKSQAFDWPDSKLNNLLTQNFPVDQITEILEKKSKSTKPTINKNKPVIGISIGDINGIGLEVILKALNHKRIIHLCTPVIYGSSKVVSYHKNIVALDELTFYGQRNAERLSYDKVNVVNCWNENVNITLGKPTDAGGKFAQMSLEAATRDLKAGLIDALVTAPIHKKSMELAGFAHVGHTEYLTKEFNAKNSLMLLANDNLRVGLVTSHIPLRAVADAITKENIINKLRIFNNTLKVDFGFERPSIAVLGLNPHAGEEGMLGHEEEKVIRPAVVEAKKEGGMMVFGPFAADGFFGSGQFNKFDGILAMYHDQGLIPFKALTFGSGVNFTAGLSCIRTSPDHGTAFDLAGKNSADSSSFLHAMFMAIDVHRNRKEYHELKENAVKKVATEEEKDETAD